MSFDITLLPDMLNASHDMIFIIDTSNTKFVYINDTVLNECGYTLNELNDLGFTNFRRPMENEAEDTLNTHIEELLREGAATDYAYILSKKYGQIPVEVHAKLVEYQGKTYNIASVRDISKRLEAEKKLSDLNKGLENLVEKRTEALQKNVALLSSYREALDESSVVSKSDLRGDITYVNEKFCEVSGYKKEEVLGKPHSILRHQDMPQTIFREMWDTLHEKKPWKGILKNRKKDGSYYWIDITIVPILNYNNQVIEYVAIRNEITELMDQRVKLQQVATTDSLTGLRNRYKLLQDIELIKNPSIALLDINRFNLLNDLYGHDFGDQVIIQIGKKIESLISGEAKKLYRLHSDVFAILNFSLDQEMFIKKIEQIVKILDESTLVVNNQEIIIEITSSISFQENDLFSTADMALKYAKKGKIGLLVYNEKLDLNRLYENNIRWINKIRSGIERDAFVPYYQPIVNSVTGKWEKYECLIRLIDEDGSVVSPFFFLDIAKNTKYYETLTKLVVQKSFETFADSSVEFSINLTIKDILNDTMQPYLEEMLLKYKIGERVVFEIVESEGIEDYDSVIKFIVKMKEYGCKIAIDDFGTGYSNFSHILKLKTDYIKIDGSLIKNLENDESALVFVKTIINFSKELQIATVAEFVENEAVQKILQELGVDYMQGYLFSPPIAKPDFLK